MNKLNRSFRYAWQGLNYCFKREANFRIHLAISLLVVLIAFLFQISNAEWMIVVLCMSLVLSLEMINTAIEQLCNIIQKEEHPVVKIIKDVSAGAVLVSAVLAAVCGLIIFLPKIIFFIKSINE